MLLLATFANIFSANASSRRVCMENGEFSLMVLAFEQGGTVITYCGLMEGVLALFFLFLCIHAISCENRGRTPREHISKHHCDNSKIVRCQ